MASSVWYVRPKDQEYILTAAASTDDGSCNEIYTGNAPTCVRGISFGQASLYLFEEAQVILFAVKTFLHSKNEYEILLNPSNSYIIKDTDVCVYIAEGPREIRDLENLVCVFFSNDILICKLTYLISHHQGYFILQIMYQSSERNPLKRIQQILAAGHPHGPWSTVHLLQGKLTISQ